MQVITFLEDDDILEPDDLIRRVFPMSYYTQATDDTGRSTFFWKRAKFDRPAWIGKALRKYRKGPNNSPITRAVFRNESVIRTPLPMEELELLGIHVKFPSYKLRAFFKEAHGVLGNPNDYPQDFVLSFGKHKGSKVSELIYRDTNYLEWLVNEATCLTHQQKTIIKEWLSTDNDDLFS